MGSDATAMTGRAPRIAACLCLVACLWPIGAVRGAYSGVPPIHERMAVPIDENGTFALHGRPVDVLPDGDALFYIRARSYAPNTGRWLQRDPSGYRDGGNLYESFRSNAVSFTDPFGRQAYPHPYVEYAREEVFNLSFRLYEWYEDIDAWLGDVPKPRGFLGMPTETFEPAPIEVVLADPYAGLSPQRLRQLFAEQFDVRFRDISAGSASDMTTGMGEREMALFKRVFAEKIKKHNDYYLRQFSPLEHPYVFLNAGTADAQDLIFEIAIAEAAKEAATVSLVMGTAAIPLEIGQGLGAIQLTRFEVFSTRLGGQILAIPPQQSGALPPILNPEFTPIGEAAQLVHGFRGGSAAEAFMARVFPAAETQVQFETAIGSGAGRFRYVDLVRPARVGNEIKVGYVRYTERVRTQIAKDFYLLQLGPEEGLERAGYYFFRSAVTGQSGADPRVFQALQQAGIPHMVFP